MENISLMNLAWKLEGGRSTCKCNSCIVSTDNSQEDLGTDLDVTQETSAGQVRLCNVFGDPVQCSSWAKLEEVQVAPYHKIYWVTFWQSRFLNITYFTGFL